MQFGFLCHQFGDQFFGPVYRDLIRYGPLYPAISLNVLVYLDALFAHEEVPHSRGHRSCGHVNKTAKRLICSFIG
jgi:hypothetical protein